MKLILASSSPRRAQLLRQGGFKFEAMAPDVDETRLAGEPGAIYVRRLAQNKARAAATAWRSASGANPERAVILAADTTVVAYDGAQEKVLEKPVDADDARRMLRLLSGRTSEVLTGVALLEIPGGREILHVETTRFTFAELSEEDIDEYIQSGEPFDKAGAFGSQGLGGKFVSRIEGCYFNVMGLPLSWVWQALKKFHPKDL